MIKLLRKVLIKFKLIFNPKGYSRINSGFGKGIYWSHQITDMRYLLGEYEPDLANWLQEKMQQGYSFIDIGSNAGYFALLASKYCVREEQQILAIEPMKDNCILIQNHINKNNFKRIQCLNFAIADSDRVVEFSDTKNMAANTYSKESILHKTSAKIAIEARSLDSLMAAIKFNHFVIKIDVEGAELDVLIGARNTLAATKPEIILATHECHVPGVEKACLDLLENLGYECVPMEDKKLVDGQRDYLCQFKL